MAGKTRIRLIILLGLLAGMGLLAGVFFWPMQGPVTETILTDGTRVTVLGTSRGGEFFATEKAWHKLARRLLPARWQGWLPQSYSARATGTSSTLTICLAVSSASGTNLTILPWEYCFCVAEDGSLFSAIQSPVQEPTVKFTPRTPTGLWSIRCEVFPRRKPELKFQFMNRAGPALGSITVHNPFQGPFPEWTPESLPITRTNGPLSLRLTDLVRYSSRYPGGRGPVTLASQWRVLSSDPLWRNATVVREVRSDATGNVCGAGSALPASETAWKLELWCRPGSQTDSGTRKFLLPMLPVLKPGQLQVLTNEFGEQDWKVRVRCVAGAGTLALTNNSSLGMYSNSAPHPLPDFPDLSGFDPSAGEGVVFLQSSKPSMLVEASPSWLLEGMQFRVFAPDGNALHLSPYLYGEGTKTGERWHLRFEPTNGANSVTLEITCKPARRFEFVVDPKQVQERR